MPISHRQLVAAARKWLARSCPVVLTELVTGSETADAFGFHHGGWTTLVECKASRPDFVADTKKWFRRNPENGMGDERYYLTPPGLLFPKELPLSWGLMEAHERRIITARKSDRFPKNNMAELNLLVSTLRRLNVQNHMGVSIRHYKIQTRGRAVLWYRPEESPSLKLSEED